MYANVIVPEAPGAFLLCVTAWNWQIPPPAGKPSTMIPVSNVLGLLTNPDGSATPNTEPAAPGRVMFLRLLAAPVAGHVSVLVPTTDRIAFAAPDVICRKLDAPSARYSVISLWPAASLTA